jgi:hypothetical protein
MKKNYLVIVAVALTLMGLVFMVAPRKHLAGFDFSSSGSGLLNMIRSFGGFYLGFAVWLFIATSRQNLVDAAILSVVTVMIGLLTGRVVSAIVDSLPDPKLLLSAAIEMIFAVSGIILTLK